jgi:hypothetical protein
MTRRLAVFGLCLSAAFAQPAVEAPRAGCLVGEDGSLRPVRGIAGAFLADVPAVSNVVSAACSDSLALVKTADALEVRDGSLQLLARWDAPPGTALFALPASGQTGFVYYAATGELLQVDAQSLPRAVLDSQSLGGRVLAIASPDLLHLIAVVEDTPGPRLVRISVTDGLIESQTPLENVAAPLALLSDGTVVFATGAGLVIRPPGSAVQRMAVPAVRQPTGAKQRAVLPSNLRPVVTERRMALPARALAIEPMGGSWLALRLAEPGAPLALRVEGGRERTCRVPTSRVPTMETAP